MNKMIRLAIQSKGRLNEESLKLLRDSGIEVDDTKRKFIGRASGFPLDHLIVLNEQMGIRLEDLEKELLSRHHS